MVFGLVNPIQEAVRNEKYLNEIFEKYEIIPYYGEGEEGSHTMLRLIYDLTSLSPSHTACKNDISTWAFGSGVDIIPVRTARVRRNEEELLSEEEKDRFEEELADIGIGLSGVIDITKVMYDNYQDSGNIYLFVRMSRVNSTWRVKIEPVHYRNAAIKRSKSGKANRIITTEYWEEDYWQKKRPFLSFRSDIHQAFVWAEKRGGNVLETIVHIRRQSDGSPYYGRPSILPALESMFVEHQGQSKDCKIAGSELVAKKIITMQEPPPGRQVKPHTELKKGPYKDPVQILAESIRKLTTNEGEEAKSLALISYPQGSNAPGSIDLDLNRDTAFDQHMVDKHSSYIYALHGWDKQLTGFSPVKSNIGGNVLLDLFTVKNYATVMPEQRFYENIWGRLFTEIGKITNPGQEMRTIKFPNLIDEVVDKLSSLKNGSQDAQPTNTTDAE